MSNDDWENDIYHWLAAILCLVLVVLGCWGLFIWSNWLYDSYITLFGWEA